MWNLTTSGRNTDWTRSQSGIILGRGVAGSNMIIGSSGFWEQSELAPERRPTPQCQTSTLKANSIVKQWYTITSVFIFSSSLTISPIKEKSMMSTEFDLRLQSPEWEDGGTKSWGVKNMTTWSSLIDSEPKFWGVVDWAEMQNVIWIAQVQIGTQNWANHIFFYFTIVNKIGQLGQLCWINIALLIVSVKWPLSYNHIKERGITAYIHCS